MSIEFKVERKVPAPKLFPRRGRRIYPFATMQVGESFALPDRESFLRASRSAYMYGTRHEQLYTCDIYQLRIWRVQ